MKKVVLVVVIGLFIAGLAGVEAAAQTNPGYYIKYSVSGNAKDQRRDDKLILCKNPSKEFQIHSIGKWVITIDAVGKGVGPHQAKFMIAPPEELKNLRKMNSADHRFYGKGTIVLEKAGTDKYNLPAAKGKFSGMGLKSGDGFTIDIEGTFYCGTL
ncbi:MAG: hypothetical protein P8013_11390 [Candidatus Sulfobium sp.]|jgi:hypothetical protein